MKESQEQFIKDVTEKPTASGRAAKQIAIDASKVPEVFAKVCESCEGVLGKLTVAESRYIRSPWFWHYSGSMHFAGPEFSYLGSAKWTLKGTRDVRIAKWSDALAFYRTTIGGGASISIEDVCHALAALNEKTIGGFTTEYKLWKSRVAQQPF